MALAVVEAEPFDIDQVLQSVGAGAKLAEVVAIRSIAQTMHNALT
jgi:hypothetical protein